MLSKLTDVDASRIDNFISAVMLTDKFEPFCLSLNRKKSKSDITVDNCFRPHVLKTSWNEILVPCSDFKEKPMDATVETVDALPTLPLVIGFRKNFKEYVNDQLQKYIDSLPQNNICEYILLDSLKELPQALSKKPQCLLFYAQGLFDQQSTIAEFMMMLKTMIHFTDPDYKIKIGFVLDHKTPFSHIKELQKAGVVGVVPSVLSWGEAETTKGFEAMLNGIPYWPKHLIDQLPGHAVKAKRETVHLTHRQKEVLELIANRGLSNKQIAKVLGISESTVKIHVSAIMKAYCVRNRTQLALTKK